MSLETEKKVKNIFIYLTPSLLMNLIPLITLPIMVRYLSPKDFGIVALTSGFCGILVNILSLNVNAAAERYYFQYRHDKAQLGSLINTTISFMLVVFLALFPVLFLFRNTLAHNITGSNEYSWALLISYLQVCFNMLAGFYLLIIRNMEEGKRYSAYTIFQTITNVVLSLFFVIVLKLSYMGLILSGFLTSILVFSILYVSFLRQFPFSFNLKMLIDNLKFGIPLIPSNLTSAIYSYLDKYLLRSLVSLSSTGLFSIAQNISNKMFIFMTAVQSTFHPIFMKDMFDRGEEGAVSIGRNFTVFTYISLTAVIVMTLFGEDFITLIAPPSYYESINVMLILLCGISTQTFGKIISAQLAYVKKAYYSFPVSLIGLVVNVGLNILLIPKFGAMGAGFSLMCTILTMNAIFVKISQRFYRIIYEKKLLIFLYFVVFGSAAGVIFLRNIGATFLLKLAFKLTALFIFIYIGNTARILTAKNFIAFKNIFKLSKPQAA